MLRILPIAFLLSACSMISPEDEKIILNDFEKVENDILMSEIEQNHKPLVDSAKTQNAPQQAKNKGS